MNHPAQPPAVELRRLHPLTPLVRGWKFLAAVLALATQQAYSNLDWRLLGLLVAVGLPVASAYGYLSWRFTRYRVDDDDLTLETGVLSRRSRRVRLDRLQAVDVVRPLFARALGLAELRLEVAGGSSTEAPLAYLSEPAARGLRAELLARAAGLHRDVPEAPEQVLTTVPPQRLVAARLLGVATPVILGVLVVLVVLAVWFHQPGLVGLVVPAAIGVVGPVVRQLVAHFDFTVADSPDGLRLRHGLLETRSQTVPPGRVQAVRIVEPWLWRRAKGWCRVEVNVAGYVGAGQETTAVLLPVAPRAEALAVLARVLPGVDVDAVELHPVPRRARWLDPVAWRGQGVGADSEFFLARRGRFRRELDVTPHARTQSVRLTQGPLQRRLRLASVHLDTTPGPVRVTAAHRDAQEARRIVAAQVERSRRARASVGPERWMTGPAVRAEAPES